MKLTEYTLHELIETIKDLMTGANWVRLLNKYGFKDIYKDGLPDIGKKGGVRPSKKEYLFERLCRINGTDTLRELIIELVSNNENKLIEVNSAINIDNYLIEKEGEEFIMLGSVIRKSTSNEKEVEAHFKEIQTHILHALENARVSIWVAMAWFTNETLAQKLLEKKKQGIDVRVIIYDDYTNSKYGVSLDDIIVVKRKAVRGGKMHHKFCVIDNQIVITGSYNWSSSAEFKNDENISIIEDNKLASNYSVEFRTLLNNGKDR